MKEVQSENFNLFNAQQNLMDELKDSCHKNSFKKFRRSWNPEVRNANDRPFLVISSSISQGEKCQNSGGES
jgi:hypothetical protein